MWLCMCFLFVSTTVLIYIYDFVLVLLCLCISLFVYSIGFLSIMNLKQGTVKGISVKHIHDLIWWMHYSSQAHTHSYVNECTYPHTTIRIHWKADRQKEPLSIYSNANEIIFYLSIELKMNSFAFVMPCNAKTFSFSFRFIFFIFMKLSV